jgi:hypothetical protein
MKNFKHIFTSLRFFFRVEEYLRKRKDYQANEEYADNKFVDAEANYRVSNSKFQIEQLHLTT